MIQNAPMRTGTVNCCDISVVSIKLGGSVTEITQGKKRRICR